MEPRTEAALAAKTAQLLPHPDEDVLEQVRRSRAVTSHANAEREHPRGVGVIQRSKGVGIPGAGGVNRRVKWH
jgi:hypothetical protein